MEELIKRLNLNINHTNFNLFSNNIIINKTNPNYIINPSKLEYFRYSEFNKKFKSKNIIPYIEEFLNVIKKNVSITRYNEIIRIINNTEIKEYNDLNINEKQDLEKTNAKGLSYSNIHKIILNKNTDKYTLFHELLHIITSSSKLEYNVNSKEYNAKIGFEEFTIINNKIENKIGNGINEAYTEFLVGKLFNQADSYNIERNIIRLLNIIIGESNLKNMYLNNDLNTLSNYISNLTNQDNKEFINFIKNVDIISTNRNLIIDNKLNKNDKEIMNKIFEEVGLYLIKLFSFYLKNEYYTRLNNNEDKEEILIDLSNDIYYFYNNININIKGFKLGNIESLKLLNDFIKEMESRNIL